MATAFFGKNNNNKYYNNNNNNKVSKKNISSSSSTNNDSNGSTINSSDGDFDDAVDPEELQTSDSNERAKTKATSSRYIQEKNKKRKPR